MQIIFDLHALLLSIKLNLYISELLRKKEKKLKIFFNFTFRFKDDVLSLDNPLYNIEIKNTLNTIKYASNLLSQLNNNS